MRHPKARESIVHGVQQLPPQPASPNGQPANAPMARLLLILIALPIVIVLAIAGFAVIAVVIAIAAVLVMMALVRNALRGSSTRTPPASSEEPTPRPPIPTHDSEGRENVRVIRRD